MSGCNFMYKNTKLAQYWHEASSQLEAERSFYDNYQEKYDGIQVERLNNNEEKRTIIVVIGESASRDYMHYYNSTCKYANTPWLENMRNNQDFFILDNGYSCFNTTIEVLKRALTECSQYNSIELNDSVSIIDVAKKVGYHTYWYSSSENHGSVIELIAKNCDVFEVLPRNGGEKHDKALIEKLQNISPNESNIVFLHLLRSHDSYNCRYPAEWEKFHDNTVESDYANSILYTDEILDEIYNYGKKNLNMDVMIYFSDHGENLEYGHHPEKTSLDTFRIPMFIVLSPSYREKHPEKVNLLKEHKSYYYSNDMMFNTILGIAGIKTNKYKAEEDFISDEYSVNEH